MSQNKKEQNYDAEPQLVVPQTINEWGIMAKQKFFKALMSTCGDKKVYNALGEIEFGINDLLSQQKQEIMEKLPKEITYDCLQQVKELLK